jgi:hypothetical protein
VGKTKAVVWRLLTPPDCLRVGEIAGGGALDQQLDPASHRVAALGQPVWLVLLWSS